MQKLKTFYLSRLAAVPRSIWALGIVSMFMDLSSELIHSLLPIFMVSTLGTSITAVGLVEGIAEATANIVKIFSGTLSDYFGKRKFLVVIGYSLAALSKPLFPLANTINLIVMARFIDRIGKGVRDAPRDAMISDIATPEIRGTCFGLRQSLDTIGAILGPLLAIGGMLLFSGNIRNALWLAFIPAVIAVVILALGVKEPPAHRPEQTDVKIQIRNISQLGATYWKLVMMAGLFTLARFSEAFLILKAQEIGLSFAFIPVILIVMNIVYALGAYPSGVLSDNVNRKTVLIIGMFFLIAADIILGITNDLFMLLLGTVLWGLYLAFSQGTLTAMVADASPSALRGTAYGIFNFICGIVMLIASVMAGILWDQYGSSVTFFAGIVFTLIALLSLLFIPSKPFLPIKK